MRIVRAGMRAFELPLVVPLATAHGPIRMRAGFWVTLEDETGRIGSGEATPLPDFGGEDREACRAALVRGLERLVALEGLEESAELAAVGESAPCARSALACALADLAAQRANVSLALWIRRRAGLAGAAASRVRTQALIAGDDAAAVRLAAARARDTGFTTFKLKLAVRPGRPDLGEDLARVAALREEIGAAARIRLDANEAWDRPTAARALAALAAYDVEFVEQPVARADVDALAALARSGTIAVAADEALIGGGLAACLERPSAPIFVVKPAAIGGIGPVIELAARARDAGIRLVFSNLIEGRIGRELAFALAAGLASGDDEESDRAVHGLGTAALLASDLDAWFEDEPGRSGAGRIVRPNEWVSHERVGLGLGCPPCWALEARADGPELGECRVFGDPVFGSGGAATTRPATESMTRSTGWLAGLAAHPAARPAFVFDGRSCSFGALVAAVGRALEGLADCGLAPGDRVAVFAPPSAEGFVSIHALFERGIVLLPLNTRFSDAELATALDVARPRALIVAEGPDGERVGRIAAEAGCSRITLRTHDAAAWPAPRLEPARPLDCAPLSKRGQGGLQSGARDSFAAAEGAALVLLTSGTSGRPKAAVLTLAQLRANAEAAAKLLGQSSDDRWLSCLPLFHIAGLSILVRAARSGACVWLEPRFDAVRVARLLESERISHVSLVATTLAALLDARGDAQGDAAAPASLRLVLVGGGPASASLLARARAAGYPIATTYGLTEAASQVATRPPGEGAPSDVDGLVPLPGFAIRIVDEADRPLGTGREGEIQVRGPSVMCGYLGDPEATSRALRGGWLSTGDIGVLAADGTLRVLERRSDLIVSGGENVYPAELESVLVEHPEIVEAGVVGVADERFGARPLAFVVWRAGASRDPGALASHCRARLAGYKVPIDFVAVDALPRNASGKLLRRELAGRPFKPRHP